MSSYDFESKVISIPDYPEPPVVFRDITPLFSDAECLQQLIKAFVEHYKDMHIDKVVGPEARGFLLATPLAAALDAGFVPARKPGKLPRETVSISYDLEYGQNTIEIHKDAIKPGDRVLIVDDLIATGGTAAAAGKLVEKMGGELVGYGVIIELAYLNPRKALSQTSSDELFSLVQYSE